MVAKMEEQGHKVYYYENIEGGHSTGANLKQYAKMDALKYVYLHRLLVDCP
jgi:prolyl oligopeptidase